ncbi:MAG: DUF4031 domain-containing protein [Planctomycetota bacterium]|nr:DUF4031 domain-containing protein [Planctomycetota bacterium]
MNGGDLRAAAIYVDALFYCPSRHPLAYAAGRCYGHLWCHMWSDDLEALHLMAARIGLRREWFQNRAGFPHYDLLPPRRAAALRLGAVERSLADWLWEKRAASGPTTGGKYSLNGKFTYHVSDMLTLGALSDNH